MTSMSECTRATLIAKAQSILACPSKKSHPHAAYLTEKWWYQNALDFHLSKNPGAHFLVSNKLARNSAKPDNIHRFEVI